MSGLKNYEIGKIDPKLKGKAYDKAIYDALKPETLEKCDLAQETKEYSKK